MARIISFNFKSILANNKVERGSPVDEKKPYLYSIISPRTGKALAFVLDDVLFTTVMQCQLNATELKMWHEHLKAHNI